MANDPDWAGVMCQLIGQLQYKDAQDTLTSYLSQFAREPVAVKAFAYSSTCPAFAFAKSAAHAWILVGGAWSPALLAQTAAGYPGPVLGLGGDEANRHPFFESAAAQVMSVVNAYGELPKSSLMIAGHSLGGCVALAVAERIRQYRGGANQTQVATFGSPRYSTHHNCANLRGMNIARYMHVRDPIPLFYPHSAEWLPGIVVNTVFQQSRVNRFTHPHGGLLLDDAFRIVPGQYPPLTSVGFASSMLSWLTSNMVPTGNNPHSMDTYIAGCKAAALLLPQPVDRPRPAESIPADGELERVSLTRLAATVETQLAATERAQRDGPLFIPPAQEVTYARSGGVWAIRWQGHVIALSTRRRSAHSLARSINAMLEHMLRQGLMDREAMGQAVGSFLDQSILSSSGITPQLPATPPLGVPG